MSEANRSLVAILTETRGHGGTHLEISPKEKYRVEKGERFFHKLQKHVSVARVFLEEVCS